MTMTRNVALTIGMLVAPVAMAESFKLPKEVTPAMRAALRVM